MLEVCTPAELALAHVYYQARGALYTDNTIRQAVQSMTALVDRAREERAVLTANAAVTAATRPAPPTP